MTNTNDVRWAHEVLDGMFAGRILSRENEQLLRSFLPELSKQMTLEEITEHVRYAWIGTSDNVWAGNSYNTEITLESWMGELYVQMQGLKNTPATVPTLPDGMRIADHVNFGRVVVSPGVGPDGRYEIFYLEPGMSSATAISEVEPDSLTFIDAAPAAPELAQALAEETWEYSYQELRGDEWETAFNDVTHLEEWWPKKSDVDWIVEEALKHGYVCRLVRRRVSPVEVINE